MPASSTDLGVIGPGGVRVTFNPGPSQISPQVIADIHEIADSGLLAESHRSARVKTVVKDAVSAMRSAMRVPDEYAILFQPSATAAMDVLVRNLVSTRSLHFSNGAFADRFAGTAGLIAPVPICVDGPWGEAPGWRSFETTERFDLVAVTHNETSTGMAWPFSELRALRDRYPEHLLAVDVTSSFGALAMDWSSADAWFGSVQKCLGLPAGLGFLIVSPRCIDRTREMGFAAEIAPWQDLIRMSTSMYTGETAETPNVLAIALLGRQMARWDLAAIEAATQRKAAAVAAAELPWTPFVQETEWRSPTVHCMQVDDPTAWHERALAAGFRLGSGYGKLKPSCIRIATFPAHSEDDVAALLAALAG